MATENYSDSRSQNAEAAHPDEPLEASDLTAFQTSILRVLTEGPSYGLAIRRALEAYYGTEINHGRLYPNLDDLVEMGFISKSELDKRTNLYELTIRGRDVYREWAEWHSPRAEGGDD